MPTFLELFTWSAMATASRRAMRRIGGCVASRLHDRAITADDPGQSRSIHVNGPSLAWRRGSRRVYTHMLLALTASEMERLSDATSPPSQEFPSICKLA